ncbi:MAG: hypothetical protein ACKO9T_03940, partial [Nitrospira sp.]
MQNRSDFIKQVLSGMQSLDRWGYITAGISLLILGMLVFVHSWFTFVTTAMAKATLLPAGLQLLNDL